MIASGTIHLDARVRGRVVEAVIGEAPGLTTGQLRARLRKYCAAADPGDAARRYDRAHDERRVVLEPTVDGTANLPMDLAPSAALAARSRINRLDDPDGIRVWPVEVTDPEYRALVSPP